MQHSKYHTDHACSIYATDWNGGKERRVLEEETLSTPLTLHHPCFDTTFVHIHRIHVVLTTCNTHPSISALHLTINAHMFTAERLYTSRCMEAFSVRMPCYFLVIREASGFGRGVHQWVHAWTISYTVCAHCCCV